eukprot:154695-Hanusia_phi.AAC.3
MIGFAGSFSTVITHRLRHSVTVIFGRASDRLSQACFMISAAYSGPVRVSSYYAGPPSPPYGHRAAPGACRR